MGNWNPKYFEKKSGSLEEAILNAVNGVKPQINEKVEYVEYKFKNEKDAMKAKLFYDGLQRMGFEVNDDNISNGELVIDAGKNDMTQYHKQIMQKYKPKVMTQEKMDAVGKEDGDIDNDGDKDASDKYLAKRRKTISKAMKKEEKDDFKTHMMYDPKTGKGYEAKTMEDHLRMKKMGYDHKKPNSESFESQGEADWNETVSIIQKKQTSMREALAKVWGFDEGHNPFKKEDKVPKGFHRMPDGSLMKDSDMDKKENKTMTGKPATKVTVDPDMKEKMSPQEKDKYMRDRGMRE